MKRTACVPALCSPGKQVAKQYTRTEGRLDIGAAGAPVAAALPPGILDKEAVRAAGACPAVLPAARGSCRWGVLWMATRSGGPQRADPRGWGWGWGWGWGCVQYQTKRHKENSTTPAGTRPWPTHAGTDSPAHVEPWRIGALSVLSPDEDVPLVGVVRPGHAQLAVEGGMFRAGAAAHRPQGSDFLLIRWGQAA